MGEEELIECAILDVFLRKKIKIEINSNRKTNQYKAYK